MKKNVLAFTVVILVTLLLSSCAIGDEILYKAGGAVRGKDCDIKLYTGISDGNLEQVKEGLEDGADINKIKGFKSSESNPVILATLKNNRKVAEYLLKNGADANYTDSSGFSILMFEAYNTDAYYCEILMKYGANITQEDKKGYTALEYVLDHSIRDTTENNIENIITIFLKSGAKIRPVTLIAALKGGYVYGYNNRDCFYSLIKRVLESLIKEGYKSGLDPVLEAAILGESFKADKLIKTNKMKKENEQQILFYTAAFGNVETIKLLEEKGLDLKTTDKLKNTPLIIASQYGNLEIVKYLLGREVDIEAQNKDNKTALYVAVENNKYNIVEYLMKKGAKSVYKHGNLSKNILTNASGNGYIEMMKLMITNGYPLNEENIGMAMVAAAGSNQVETLKYSLANGAIIDNVYNGFTALEMSCLHGNVEAIKFLLDHGANENGKNGEGRPLITAVEFGNIDSVEYLLKKGANLNASAIVRSSNKTELKGESALMGAIMSGDLDIIKLLVENGANFEYQNEISNKDTAIIWAAGRGSRHIMEYLIQKGVKINYQNDKGQTALMRATLNGQLDNVKILMKYKADVSLKDKEGHTVLDIAKPGKYKDIVTFLESTK